MPVTKEESSFVHSGFYMVGFAGAVILTVFDFYTSYTGVSTLAKGATPFWTVWLPIGLASVAIAFNAAAPRFFGDFLSEKQHAARDTVFFCFFVFAVLYDIFSSGLGTLVGITGADAVEVAFQRATTTHFVFVGFAATGMVLGPMLVGKFYLLLRESGGIFSQILGSFSEGDV